jgi:hypothetical protein
LKPAAPVRAALAEALTRLRLLKARQDSHGANRQQMTQELTGLITDGKELARRLRGLTKGLLGTRTERLVQFNMTPIRARKGSRRTAPPSDTSPPADPALKVERKSAVGE